MLKQLGSIKPLIGNTPLVELCRANLPIRLFLKLEYTNYSGSIKDRPAYNILQKAIANREVTRSTPIVESSSGNFAIALASICGTLGLDFTPVIDANINPLYEQQLNLMCRRVVKIDERDHTGGYLLNRIATVQQICQRERAYWPNQYENPHNYLSYYEGLGPELCDAFQTLDYVFIGVSSAGTITGLSRKLTERFPHIKVVAVDVEGSVIFGGVPQHRYVSGIGASKVPPVLQHAAIHEVVQVAQSDVITGTKQLLSEQAIFGGSSTGAVYWAIKHYDWPAAKRPPNVLFLCADRGTAYMDTIFDPAWVRRHTEVAVAG